MFILAHCTLLVPKISAVILPSVMPTTHIGRLTAVGVDELSDLVFSQRHALLQDNNSLGQGVQLVHDVLQAGSNVLTVITSLK